MKQAQGWKMRLWRRRSGVEWSEGKRHSDQKGRERGWGRYVMKDLLSETMNWVRRVDGVVVAERRQS